MRFQARIVLAVVAGIFLAGTTAQAQVIHQIPADAVMIVKVSQLDAVSRKAGDFFTTLGLAAMVPQLADPLTAGMTSGGITQGFNKSGEFALAILNPEAPVTWDKPNWVMLFPVTDYKAFLANFPDASTTGAVTSFHFKGDHEQSFAANWGDYAAVSNSSQVVATAPASTLELSGLCAKQWDAKDAVLLVNIKPLRTEALKQIESARTMAASHMKDFAQQHPAGGGAGNPMAAMGKLEPVGEVLLSVVLDFAREFVQDANAASFGLSLTPDGVAFTSVLEFEPSTSMGQFVSEIKNTDESFTVGLPEAKYMAFGGMHRDPQHLTRIINAIADPAEASLKTLGSDFAPAVDYLEALKETARSSGGGQTFGWIAPSGMLGQSSLMQAVGISRGDSQVLLDCQQRMVDDQQKLMASLGLQAPGTTQTFTKAGKTLDGVTFNVFTTTFNMAAQGNAGMQAQMIMNWVYGPGGLKVYLGALDDKTQISAVGLDDPTLTTAIDAARAGNDPMGKSMPVKAVAAQLPTQRVAAFYVPLDVWVNTVLNYARAFGQDMGVKLPDDLPPIGVTISGDGSAIRCDEYVPTQLVRAITSASLQVYMTMTMHQQPQNPGGNPGGGGAPGGL